jgi:hypothetical protein
MRKTTLKNATLGAYEAYTVEPGNMLREFGLIAPILPKWRETGQGNF